MSGLNDVLAARQGRQVRTVRSARPRRRSPQRAAMPRVLEKTEQAHGVVLLRQLGGKVYVLGTPRRKSEQDHGTHQTPGISDVICLLPRALGVLFWEVKAEGGKTSDTQAELQELVVACTAAGRGVYHCLGTYDDLIAWLMSHELIKVESVPHYRLPPAGRTTVHGVILE